MIDHWGAAGAGSNLDEIEPRLYAASRDAAARSSAVIIFIGYIFTAVFVPVYVRM